MNDSTAERATMLEEATATFDFAKLKEFSELTERNKQIEDELKANKARMLELEPVILEQMADVGMNNARINGRTYYIKRDLFAGPADGYDKVSVALALKASGLDDYVTETYNSNSLAAYVRSCKQEAEGGDTLTTEQIRSLLPKPLRAVLRVGENFRLGSRKS